MMPLSSLSASRARIAGIGAAGGAVAPGAGTVTAGAGAVTTGAGGVPDSRYQRRPSTPSPASSGISHRPRCGASGITVTPTGATCSTRCVTVGAVEPRKPDTAAGMPDGMTPPGVNWPISFGARYPIAVETPRPLRPSRPAIPSITVLPSACSTWGPVSTTPLVLPSHEPTSAPKPADVNFSRNPPIPPGKPVISCTTSCTSGPAFPSRPNRPATSSITLSNTAIRIPPIRRIGTIRTAVAGACRADRLWYVASPRGASHADCRRARGHHTARGLHEVVRGTGRPGRLHCASDLRWGHRLPAGVQALDLDLLAAHLVVHGLDVVCAGHAQPDFLDDPCRLGLPGAANRKCTVRAVAEIITL